MEIQALVRSICREYPNVEPEIIRGAGLVQEAVEGTVKKHEIDLVVIGTRGRTGVGKFLLGSQAEDVLRPYNLSGSRDRTKCSHASAATRTVEVDTAGHGFCPASLTAAPYAISLAEEWAAQLALLHIIEKREVNEMQMPEDSVETSAQRDSGPCCRPMQTYGASPRFSSNRARQPRKFCRSPWLAIRI
jgi:hypothetical protein